MTPFHKLTAVWRQFGLFVLIGCILLSCCGCGNILVGTYRTTGDTSQSLSFIGDSITMCAFGINTEGTYTVEGDEIHVTYSLFGKEYQWEKSFVRDGDTLTVGGVEFVKQTN